MKSLEKSIYRYETLELHVLPLRADNYTYVIRDSGSGLILVIDPSETTPVIEFLDKKDWGLDYILDTHHHNDHTEGNVGLKEQFGSKIGASQYDVDQGRITGKPDFALRDGEKFVFGDYHFRAIYTPGHTLGHVSLFIEEAHWLFSGDTMFSLGCGRLFEGDAAMLWSSFQKLRELPDDTLVFCGHEYTEANAKFIDSLQLNVPGYDEFRQNLINRLSTEKKSIPSLLSDEKRFNPYFLADDTRLQKFGSNPTEVFGKIRSLKDQF